MSETNSHPTPPATFSAMPSSDDEPIDVVNQLIALCRLELEAIAHSLDFATEQGETERATAAVLEIQAISLLHGLDDIAVLATETEHAMDLNTDSKDSWKPVARQLVSQCRPNAEQPGQTS